MKKSKLMYVRAKSETDDCNEFILTGTHIKPRRNAKDFMRCIGRKDVLAALNNSDLSRITCTDIPGSSFDTEWKIVRNPDGSIGVGCTLFSKEAVAKIRKWAKGATA